jgi:PleD family two-component response regulator
MRADVEALAVPHAYSSGVGVVTISIGVATLIPQRGMHPSSLIRLVDTALYSVKRAGRNVVRAA